MSNCPICLKDVDSKNSSLCDHFKTHTVADYYGIQSEEKKSFIRSKNLTKCFKKSGGYGRKIREEPIRKIDKSEFKKEKRKFVNRRKKLKNKSSESIIKKKSKKNKKTIIVTKKKRSKSKSINPSKLLRGGLPGLGKNRRN